MVHQPMYQPTHGNVIRKMEIFFLEFRKYLRQYLCIALAADEQNKAISGFWC